MIHVAVIGHHTRQEHAERLAESLSGTLFLDPGDNGARWNHERAHRWGRGLRGHLLVVEDDAQPVPGFLTHITEWVTQYPDDLISYYLSTDWPPQTRPEIQRKLRTATDHIRLNKLIHGVCYSIPTNHIPTMRPDRKPDTELGTQWVKATGRPIIYPTPSLVDHADWPSIDNSGKQRPPRKAHQTAGALTETTG